LTKQNLFQRLHKEQALVSGYLFIVLLFAATYYGPDVFVYYALTFLIPVGVGLYLIRARKEPVAKQG